MTPFTPHTPDAERPSGDFAREVLYQSQTTRIFRTPRPTGAASVICKEPLGANALERLHHEKKIITRLAGIEGVPRLAALPHPAGIMALEDCAGVPLLQAIRSQALELPALLAVALQLARTVARVHRAGVLHQNITPANILLAGLQRQPVLIDFHLATTFAEGQPGFTHHRDIPGTLAYLAPEQTGRTGRTVDQRADLYALGATLYELATGHPPFESADPLQLIHDHLARQPAPPAALAPGLPQALSDIVLRLLEKEPDRRYQSAEGLAHDLSRLIERLARDESAAFLLGERDFALRLAAPSRLVGRETEIDALRQAFLDTLRGNSRVVLVAGAPGVGKTALINALRPMVTAQRGWFVSGKFDQYRRDAPSATAQALRALGRLLLAEPEVELTHQRERILAALGPNAGVICSPRLPEFVTLLGEQPTVPLIDPAQTEARLLLTILDLLRSIISTTRPLVMVIDDLQWAGPISIHFIEAVLAARNLPGLLLVGAYREAAIDAIHPMSAALPRWAQLECAPVRLRLSDLPPADLGTLLAEMLRLPAPQAAALAQALNAHTGGNPFDTVELVNALRRDGALVPGSNGWDWDARVIRRYIGQGNVVDLLSARIARLPEPGRALLETMACLGGEVALSQLRAATGLSATELEEHMAAPLEDGLLVFEQGDDSALRFRHDRVQQAAHGAREPAQRCALHLTLARRLALKPEFSAVAAQQYLPAIEALHEPDERRRAAGLFHEAATHARRSANYAAMERFLTAALGLLGGMKSAADEQLFASLEIGQHTALYSLGRLEEADGIYRSIEGRSGDALELVEAACVQVSSLTNRGRPREAVALGLSLLRQLGLQVPSGDGIGIEVSRKLDALYKWVGEVSLADDQRRPEAAGPRGVAVATLINRLMAPSRLCDPMAMAWLVLESQRLWAEHGPCARLALSLGHATLVTIALRQEYRTGYEAVRHVLSVSQARAYEPEASQVADLFALSTSHWFEPLENSVALIQRAREAMLHEGDLQSACFTYYVSVTALLDCEPTLERYASEVEAGLVFAIRTGNEHGTDLYLGYRQLLRALRGQTRATGSLTDGDYDEAGRAGRLGANPSADATFHLMRALAAALFADMGGLVRHTAALLRLRSYLQSFYATALVHLLQALALAQRVKTAVPGERAELLRELDLCRDWLALRATDCPVNFGHLLKLVEAERAWCAGDPWHAARAFDTALREAQARQRPWHHALISERAGLFHLEQGLEHTGRQLLAEARQLYTAWGASAKARELERTHAFLRIAYPLRPGPDSGSHVSGDSIDMLGVLRASQALSSQTSLDSLKTSVVKLLGTMTGATSVRFALQDEDQKQWLLSATSDQQMAPIPVEEAGVRGLLPLSAFHYAERTREPLLVEDATRDDRFARDPYLAGLARCSLLVIPILSQGVPRAVLLLENQLSRGAFTTHRLDAVMLIAGQLAVSLENALLYEKLEQRVREKTRELRETQAKLIAAARQAGMAEIATNVLHNVGNILNSVNVSAGLLGGTLRTSRAHGLSRAVQLMDEHAADLGGFLTLDGKGKLLPGYLGQLALALAAEQQGMAEELARLIRSIDHIKDVVATQQSYAGSASIVEPLQICDLAEDALRMSSEALVRHQVTVVKEFAPVPVLPLDRAQVLLILVNLISNAKYAMESMAVGSRQITLQVQAAGGLLRVSVADQGEGIAAENLTRIFAHGFTTRKAGHGFGLHSCALAARQMGGTLTAHSDGPGRGATFTLELPIDTAQGAP
ncbi:trifunctional serine/threonine-protein kinase/ATP-binding protein/sensor histidine kinase [Polaromonas naphthalenivorans]|uniref:histidine kinase n=1 Tax=Polaromonas naphthalenivorans (strain CJ2) TaxID=365044 RepID=A1VUL7_POLNA|nr:AAA family ATPase [Polaromonas naphthalenivorans]ABM39345.1 ATP-binding region, ATPase domain protein [Polaromonas naphthalenivorans CJ2]